MLSDAVPFAVHAYSMDEASGTRADDVGTADLTDNNIVGSASGKFGNAAVFVRANDEYLSRAYNASLSPRAHKWCLSFWCKLANKTNSQHFVSADDDSGSASFFVMYDQGVDRLRLSMFAASGFGGESTFYANTYGSPPTNTWMLVVVYHNPDTDLLGISVDGTAYDTDGHAGDVYATTGTFAVGDYPYYSNNNLDGDVDDVVVLNGYVLDDTEVDELWASGAGVAFADWAGGPPPTTNRRRRVLLTARG